jgi:Tol biopolymer transport system component
VVVFAANGSNLRVFPLNQDISYLTLQGRYSWSADGTRVAYAMGPEDTHLSAIFVTDVRTGTTKRLTDLQAWRTDVSFSPDGRALAFSSTGNVGSTGGLDAERDLYTIEIDTRRVRRVTATPNWNEYRPVHSPDGGWLAYDRQPFEQPSSVKPAVRRIAVNGTADRALGVNGEVYGWLR